ncbi:MAG: ABC transporter permease [Desulfobacterales bacterium]|nr:ABC transporter permease [Desulfobacterales bacterium]
MVVNSLFGVMVPIGQIIRTNKFPFTVIGMHASKRQTTWGQDHEEVV